jgi:predicted TIM-barrel fold metal-dependent hydrolase
MSGVLERHPNLRAGFLEGNCAWLPWLLWRMDEHHEWWETKQKEAPSTLFKRQCYVSIDSDEAPGLAAVEQLDGDNICYSTDYPHGDCKFPRATDTFFEEMNMSERHRKKVLWENCAKLYSF